MILLDTNVVVALLDPRESLHARARKDLARLEKRPLVLIPAVLTESLFHLDARHSRSALRAWLTDARVGMLALIEHEAQHAVVLDWLLRYADHTPDYADGCLAVLSGLLPKAKVWTYDAEFRTIWRRPDGSRIPLAAT